MLDSRLAVCRLAAGAPIPEWAESGSFVSIVRTDRELSIVTDERVVPGELPCESGFRPIGFDGQLDFALTGVLADLCRVLAAVEISVFAISTFDSDYVLVRDSQLLNAREALERDGYRFDPNR